MPASWELTLGYRYYAGSIFYHLAQRMPASMEWAIRRQVLRGTKLFFVGCLLRGSSRLETDTALERRPSIGCLHRGNSRLGDKHIEGRNSDACFVGVVVWRRAHRWTEEIHRTWENNVLFNFLCGWVYFTSIASLS